MFDRNKFLIFISKMVQAKLSFLLKAIFDNIGYIITII
jgi:hypothetical protein